MSLIKKVKTLLKLAEVVTVDNKGTVHFKSDTQAFSTLLGNKAPRRRPKKK